MRYSYLFRRTHAIHCLNSFPSYVFVHFYGCTLPRIQTMWIENSKYTHCFSISLAKRGATANRKRKHDGCLVFFRSPPPQEYSLLNISIWRGRTVFLRFSIPSENYKMKCGGFRLSVRKERKLEEVGPLRVAGSRWDVHWTVELCHAKIFRWWC